MTTKHTPGPWSIKPTQTKYEENSGERVTSKSGEVAQVQARRFEPCLTSEAIDLEERVANARLIASAPELLESLNDLLEVFEAFIEVDQVANGEIVDAHLKARAAIAKATGS